MTIVKDKVKIVLCGNKKITEKCLTFLQKRKDTEVVLWVKDSSTKQVAQLIKEKKPDYIFSIQHEYLIPKDILEIPKFDCINLHFGLLPEYGGCYPIAHSILNNEDYGGFTFHKMTEKLDDGPIIYKQKVYIKNLVAVEAYNKIVKEAFQFFIAIYPKFVTNTYKTEEIKNIGTYYKKDSIDFKKDCIITPDMTEEIIMKKFRAFMFPRYQNPILFINNKKMNIYNIIRVDLIYSEDFLRNINVHCAYSTYVFENIEGKRFLTWID